MKLVLFFLFNSTTAWPWGELGHRIIAENAVRLSEKSLPICKVRPEEIVSHVNDPDKIWRNSRILHPHEAQAHFFHVDRQPPNWRDRKEPVDRTQGFLVYRILDWIEESKTLLKQKNHEKLSQYLYGIAHYLGDLTQPLHLHHDYDGQEAGLPDIHTQFETKMLNRFEIEMRSIIQKSLEREKIPEFWKAIQIKNLIFDIATQSHAKVERLFKNARPALQITKRRKGQQSLYHQNQPRFVKPILWKSVGSLAVEQLSLASKLVGHVINHICLAR